MPIYPFERSVYPKRYPSPFISGEPPKAPGGIGDMVERGEGEKHEGGGIGRKRARKPATAVLGGPGGPSSRLDLTDRYGPSRGLYVGPPIPGVSTPTAAQPVSSSFEHYEPPALAQLRGDVDRSIVTASGGASALGGQIVVDRLPPETCESFCKRLIVHVHLRSDLRNRSATLR